MIEIGGHNLPKTISAHLGSKLAKLYKSRGITGIENGLKKSYEILSASPTINKIDDNTLELCMKYPEDFCPIGGGYDPDKAEAVQQSICYPYTIGFLNEIDPCYKYSATIQDCILKSKNKTCRYLLNMEKVENVNCSK